MPFISGTINKIFTNTIDGGDQFGNNFRHTVYLRDVEGPFGFGSRKKDNLYIKSADGELRVGDEIEFQYTENGKYKNAKIATVLRTKEAAKRSEGTQSSTPRTAQGSASFDGSAPNPAAVGQVLNLAIEMKLIKKLDDLQDANVARAVVAQVKAAKEAIAAVWNTTSSSSSDDAEAHHEAEIQSSHSHTADTSGSFDDGAPF